MWGRIEQWFWFWVYLALYILGIGVIYAVLSENVTEGEPSGLAEIGAPLLAFCAALTVLSNTVNANKEAKIPLQDFAPGVFAVISAYFWVASTDYVDQHPSDLGLIGSFSLLLAVPALAALVIMAVYLLIDRLRRRIIS